MILYYVLLGVFFGIAGTIVVIEMSKAISAYKDKKQLEFEAAVERAARQRERNNRHLEEVAGMGWSHVEPTDNPRHPSNVRRLTGTDSSPYKFDDPYADV